MSAAWRRLGPWTSNGITLRQFHQAEGVEDWRVVGDGACAWFRTGSFAAGARLVRAIGELAGLGDHQPDVDLCHDGVTVRLLTVTGDWYGLSERDLELARQISALAREQGVPADPSMVRSVQVSIDARRRRRAAVLACRARLRVPRRQPRRGPGRPARPRAVVLVQQMDTPRPQRNRIHVDVWVPYELAEARVAAAVAAGGRLLTDEHAPAWWVLADPEGNEACVATSMSRD